MSQRNTIAVSGRIDTALDLRFGRIPQPWQLENARGRDAVGNQQSSPQGDSHLRHRQAPGSGCIGYAVEAANGDIAARCPHSCRFCVSDLQTLRVQAPSFPL